MTTESSMIEGFDPGDDVAPAKKKPGRPPNANKLRPDVHVAAKEKIRPEIRDSVRDAEEYARQVLESMGDTVDQSDEFYISKSVIPDGWTYEWKRVTVAGKEDPHYMVGLLQKGWRPVPVTRHPELMPAGWKGAIEKKGLRLMELPKILTDRAAKAHIAESRDVLRNSERILQETPANTAPREEFPDKLKKIGRDWVPSAVQQSE